MSETQIYKTVTFTLRGSLTVESALGDYIANEKRMLDSGILATHIATIIRANIERAEQALNAIHAGALHEGMKP